MNGMTGSEALSFVDKLDEANALQVVPIIVPPGHVDPMLTADLTVTGYVKALIANYAWRVAKAEVMYLMQVGAEQYIAQRRGTVDKVIEKAKAAGTLLGGLRRGGERTVDYLEDKIGYDTSYGSSLPQAGQQTPGAAPWANTPGTYQMMPVGQPVPFNQGQVPAGIPPHVHTGMPVTTFCNPYAVDPAVVQRLERVKALFPQRAGESDEKYLNRVVLGFQALAEIVNGRC